MIEVLARYLEILKARAVSYTKLDHSRRTIERLIIYLQQHEIKEWREVNLEHLENFLAAESNKITYRGDFPAPNTIIIWSRVLQGFFQWQQTSRRLLINPAENLKSPKPPVGKVRLLSEQEVIRLLETANLQTPHGIRDRAIMEVLYATAIRIGEAYKLDLYDVDTKAQQLIVREGKGQKARVVPLIGQALEWVARYLRAARPLLAVGLKGRAKPKTTTAALWLAVEGKRLSYVMMGQLINKYAASAGLDASAHSLRHSCATHLLHRGASIDQIRRLLGHDCLDTTQIYTHIETSDLHRIMSKHKENK